MFDARGISVPLHLRLRTANDGVFRPVCLERKLVQHWTKRGNSEFIDNSRCCDLILKGYTEKGLDRTKTHSLWFGILTFSDPDTKFIRVVLNEFE